MSDTYVDGVLKGKVIWTDIDDYIEQWHEQEGDGSIEEFLGMSPDDYGLYVEEPVALRFIIAASESNESVADLLGSSDDQLIAARGLDANDAEKVRGWLKATGRL